MKSDPETPLTPRARAMKARRRTYAVTLASGREVYPTDVRMESTYAGLLEGSREQASAMILKVLPSIAQKALPGRGPIVVVPSETWPLPHFVFFAALLSTKACRTREPDYQSQLVLCWFADRLDRTILWMIANTITDELWESEAEDFDAYDI